MKKIAAFIVALACLGARPAHAASLSEDYHLGVAFAVAGNKTLQSATAARAKAAAAKKSASGKITWIRIPGTVVGKKFSMGAADLLYAQPVHAVSVASFDMSQSPVTNKQYAACVSAKACTPYFAGCGAQVQGDNEPVVCVTWQQAGDFAKWAHARLPSEAEYEYAAKSAGKLNKYPWGDDAPSCDKAVYAGCDLKPKPVCSKPAGNTMQSLCDMSGEIWEWTQDIWHSSYNGAPNDGQAWGGAGSYRVVRGGFTGNLRSSSRYDISAGDFSGIVGFRVVK